MWEVSLKHPVLTSFLCGEFLLHIPCCLCFYVGSFSYTSRALLMFMQGMVPSFLYIFIFGVSLTHHVLVSFFIGGFSYTSRAGFIFMWGVSLTHTMLASFLCGEFLLHIQCWLLFLSGEFLLPIPCCIYIYPFWHHFYLGSISYTSSAAFIFIWGVSLTPPVLALIWSADFLLHIPCSFYFYQGSFSYNSRAAFIFIWGVCLTHPMLASFFHLGSFSYTSRAGFIVIWGVSLTHPMLASFLSGEFLLHIPCWL